MLWNAGGPRRESPTSARWTRLGRLDVARLRVAGDRSVRVLLIGARTTLDALGPDGTDLGSGVANGLASRTGRGVALDLLADPLAVLPGIRADERFSRLWRYDVLVVLVPRSGRAADLTDRMLARVRAQSAVLVVHDPSVPASTAAGAVEGCHPCRDVALDLAREDAAAAADRIAAAVVPLLRGAARNPARPAGDLLRSVRPGLDRVVRIARRSFAVDAAAIDLLRRDEVVRIATAGGERGDPRGCGRPTPFGAPLEVIGDTWQEPALRGRPAVQGPDGIRFYAAHAIAAQDGARVGSLCVYDRAPHDPGEFDFSMLRDLALLAEAELVAEGAI